MIVSNWVWRSSLRFSWISPEGSALIPCVACEIGSALETLRRFDRRSDTLREELRLVPIELCGAETRRGSVLLRDRLPAVVRPLLNDEPRDRDEGPADRMLPREKDRLDANVPSACGRSGDDAALVGMVAGVTASLMSYTLNSSSASTSPCRMCCWADTRVGVYLRSGYIRLMGLGMPLIEGLRRDASLGRATFGVK